MGNVPVALHETSKIKDPTTPRCWVCEREEVEAEHLGQLREGDRPWEGSLERIRGSMNEKQVRRHWWGERPRIREALMTNAPVT